MSFTYEPVIQFLEVSEEKQTFRIDPFLQSLDYETAEKSLETIDSLYFTGTIVPGIADPLFSLLFFFYGDFYGTVKGDSCLFYPTCSHYSKLCIRDYGLIQGLWMTFGRLARAHTNSDSFYPIVSHPEGIRYFDPPEHEVFSSYLTIDPEVRFDEALHKH